MCDQNQHLENHIVKNLEIDFFSKRQFEGVGSGKIHNVKNREKHGILDFDGILIDLVIFSLSVNNTALTDSKSALVFRKTRRIDNFRYSTLTATFFQLYSSRRSMSF